MTDRVALVRAEIERRMAVCEAAIADSSGPPLWDSTCLCTVIYAIIPGPLEGPDECCPQHGRAAWQMVTAHSPSFMLGVYRQHLDVLDRHGVCAFLCHELKDILALYRDVQEGAP